jgi:hypothetical protein
MHLLEKPWLIIARTSRSRAVIASLMRLLGCAKRPPAWRASHRESRLPTKSGSWRSSDVGVPVPEIKVAAFQPGVIELLLSVKARIAIVVRRNLTIWNAAIYCTPVVRDSLIVSLR